jgi:prepilin-type N-terminal cleavage/methylation domain-containing protein
MNNRSGFTLIELLIVIAILGILSVAVVTALNIVGNLNKGTLARSKTFNASIENALSINQVGKWSFEETSSPSKDTSGYNNDGTWGGAVTTSTPEECNLGFGRCVDFGGENSSIRVGDPVSLRVQTHTLAFWIKFKNVASGPWRSILQKYSTSPSSHRVPGIWRSAGFPQRFHWRYDPGNQGFGGVGPNGEGTDFKLDEWYHIVGVKNATTLKLYVNGNFIASTGVPDSISQGSGDFFLGTSPDYPGTNSVLLDEVAIYSEALTLSQIQKLYAQGVIRHALAMR